MLEFPELFSHLPVPSTAHIWCVPNISDAAGFSLVCLLSLECVFSSAAVLGVHLAVAERTCLCVDLLQELMDEEWTAGLLSAYYAVLLTAPTRRLL